MAFQWGTRHLISRRLAGNDMIILLLLLKSWEYPALAWTHERYNHGVAELGNNGNTALQMQSGLQVMQATGWIPSTSSTAMSSCSAKQLQMNKYDAIFFPMRPFDCVFLKVTTSSFEM